LGHIQSILMLRFEEYLSDFTNTVNLLDFIINLLVATLLSLLVRYFYIRYGKAFSNRERFSDIFVPMALATLLIITVVQASIALSLGLVGALSIVRFRAAIKEPEELTYIFLVIGIGLTCGANKPILAIAAILLILLLIFIIQSLDKSKIIHSRGKILVNLVSKSLSIDDMASIVNSHFDMVELKRYQDDSKGLNATFLVIGASLEAVSALNAEARKKDEDAVIHIMDQTEMVI
jgi:uncharacterized membrane protein YhiD involved in acid resistance